MRLQRHTETWISRSTHFSLGITWRSRNKNGQSNTRLETHFKEAIQETKDTLRGFKKDIQRLKVPNWKTLVQDRRRWMWLGRPKLCTKSCRAVLRRRITWRWVVSLKDLLLYHGGGGALWYSITGRLSGRQNGSGHLFISHKYRTHVQPKPVIIRWH